MIILRFFLSFASSMDENMKNWPQTGAFTLLLRSFIHRRLLTHEISNFIWIIDKALARFKASCYTLLQQAWYPKDSFRRKASTFNQHPED